MNWFKELSNSEQKLIKYGTVLVLVALFWVFVYKPINQSIQLKSKQQLTLTQQLKQMESSKKLLKFQNINNTESHRDLNQPFNAWIDSKLLQNKLSQFVTRSEPKDAKTLILTFEAVIFDELIKWLQPLEQNFNVSISEADITLTDRSNGLCNARITLEEK